MSLVLVAELRALVSTGKNDETLQAIIDREEAEIVRVLGAIPDGATAITEEHEGGLKNIYLRRPVLSVSSVTEQDLDDDTATTLTAGDDYYVWKAQARIERLPKGATWGELVTVTYVPVDDSARWKQVIIELCRLALERTAMRSEDVADEYEYQAPDWEAERLRLYRRLMFPGV